MEKIEIIRKYEYKFTVKDMNGMEYNLLLLFENVEYEPQTGDYLFISSNILSDPEVLMTPTLFGPPTDKEYVKKPLRMTKEDFIVVSNEERMFVYQRYYG